MGEKMPLVRIEILKGGAEVRLTQQVTLRELAALCVTAERAGFPIDSPLKYGDLPGHLAEYLYVEKTEDFQRMRSTELKVRAKSGDRETSEKAWSEIERRIDAFGLAGDD